jgi:hypothetical protein
VFEGSDSSSMADNEQFGLLAMDHWTRMPSVDD